MPWTFCHNMKRSRKRSKIIRVWWNDTCSSHLDIQHKNICINFKISLHSRNLSKINKAINYKNLNASFRWNEKEQKKSRDTPFRLCLSRFITKQSIRFDWFDVSQQWQYIARECDESDSFMSRITLGLFRFFRSWMNLKLNLHGNDLWMNMMNDDRDGDQHRTGLSVC